MEPDPTVPAGATNEALRDDLPILDELIVGWIEKGIASKGYHLLSRLGQDLGGSNVQEVRRLTGKKLTEYVATRFSDKFEVVPLQQLGKNIFGVVQRGKTAENLELPSRENEPDNHRYNKHFWAAFSVPLASPGQIRLLNVESFYFEDREQNALPKENQLIISPDLIAPVDEASRDEHIKRNIDNWLAESKFDRLRVLTGSTERKEEERGKNLPFSSSALDLLLSYLDKSQLQRTALPLDVIATLAKKRV